MVEGGEACRGERAQRLDPLGEGGEQQGLHQPVVVAEAGGGLRVGGPAFPDLAGGHAVLALQQRQQLGAVELLRIVEAHAHRLSEGLVALGDHVEEVAHRDDVAELEAVALIDEELEHELEGGALALQERGYGDQGLHERRSEGIDLPEHRAVTVAGQQGGEDLLADLRGPLEGGVELRARRRVLREEHPALHDRRQVAVLQGDLVEACLPPVQHVREPELSGAGQVLADQFAQVPLAGDEAHDGDRPVGPHRLHELRDLLAFPVDEGGVRGVAREPQDQLVQEQDEGVVAELPGVPGHDRQPFVERHEMFAAVRGAGAAHGAEEGVDQIPDQTDAVLVAGGGGEGGIEGRGIPVASERAPAAATAATVPAGPDVDAAMPAGANAGTAAIVRGAALPAPARSIADGGVQGPEERRVAHGDAQGAGVGEQAIRPVEPRRRRRRMHGSDMLGVVPEDRGLHARRADQVVRHDQEAPAGGPRIGLRHGAGQLGRRAGARVAAQQQGQHRHEVALAAPEAAVQVGALARALLDRPADQRQRILEAAGELRGHHVVAQGLLGALHPLRQPQHEVALVDAPGEIEDVGDGGHGPGSFITPSHHALGVREPAARHTGTIRPPPATPQPVGRYAGGSVTPRCGHAIRPRSHAPVRPSPHGPHMAKPCSAGARLHIPHTVIVRPSEDDSSRRKIFSSHAFPSLRSKMTRWPACAAHRSMYPALCSSPSRRVASRLFRSTLHSITYLPSRAGPGGPSPLPPPRGQTISRSVRPRPRPYSRSMRPPLFTTRCRNACNTSCGPAST